MTLFILFINSLSFQLKPQIPHITKPLYPYSVKNKNIFLKKKNTARKRSDEYQAQD